ncbi:ribose-phosphate diphosphokinase [Hippea maritima]|uniref:Ribose-phosphate pyrophosphokinase n=1 Tax=Hippea maritima (strain ATCC 700847 / DSM 10411 / MH2) TaxID=760142 RepID=F2LWG9_HIPMA|nr:ribose-phosphate pyrophosphokinase [Hippea maritima]AEA34078.1 ribose-phosphate pyrophosphokinase [Hippea maritima DSM 10411]
MSQLKLISGTANRALAEEISRYLGVGLAEAQISRFSDGEIYVQIDESVRGADVFLIQSLSSPVNDNIMELLVTLDALKRSSASSITVVVPYYAYARQDRKVLPRVPISAKLLADLITTAGADRIMSMDLHAGQIQGFFDIPVDHLYAAPIMLKYIRENMASKDSDLVIVSPDAGGVERARYYAKKLGCSIAIIDKRRPKPNVSEIMHIIGDVKDKVAVIVDDIVDTAGTLTNAAKAIHKEGAKEVYACCTHPVLSGNAIEKINNSPLKELAVTNTITFEKPIPTDKIKVLSVGEIIGEAIRRVYHKESLSAIFD